MQEATTKRYLELYQKRNRRCLIVGDNLWSVYQKIIVPVGPFNKEYYLSTEAVKKLLLFFKEALLIRSTNGFRPGLSGWYCVISDCHVDIGAMNAKKRREVTKGLGSCFVKRLGIPELKKEGWPLFVSAFKRYKHSRLKISEAKFQEDFLIEGFEDIVHNWGVYEMATGKLIGYARCFVYDKVEVNYSDVKLHPEYLRLHSSYALFYSMNKFYLEDSSFQYVNDGFRSLLHDTNVQNFLISKFNFKKKAVDLRIYYRPWVRGCLSLTYPFRKTLGCFYRPLSAFYKLEEIGRNQKIAE